MSISTKEWAMTINMAGCNGKTNTCYQSANEQVIAHVPVAAKDDLHQAVQAAKAAFRGWAELSAHERQSKLEAFADEIHKNREEIAKLFVMEMGRPYKLALWKSTGRLQRAKPLRK